MRLFSRVASAHVACPAATTVRLRGATACVHAGLTPGGWAASQFADCTLDTMWPTFLDMYNTSGFTNRKLRIRMSMQPQATENEARHSASDSGGKVVPAAPAAASQSVS